MEYQNYTIKEIDVFTEVCNEKLIRLYHNFLYTIPYIQVYHTVVGCDFYGIEVWNDSCCLDVVIYKIQDRICEILNTFSSFSDNEGIAIIEYITKKHIVKKIILSAQYSALQVAMPNIIFANEDIILRLPTTKDLYFNSFGKQTKKHLKYYKTKIKKEFSDIQFIFYHKEECSDCLVHQIVQFNRERIQSKGQISGIDDDYENRLKKYIRYYGKICMMYLDDKPVAGTLGYEVGQDFYLQVLAHDNAYNKYNIGQLCLLETINSEIDSKMDTFHFLWGNCEYKYRFGGSAIKLYRQILYLNYSWDYFCIYLQKIKQDIYLRLKSNEKIRYLWKNVLRK